MIQNHNMVSALLVAVLCSVCTLGLRCRHSGNPPQNDDIFAEQDRRQITRDSIDSYQRFTSEAGQHIVRNEQVIAEIRVRIITGEAALKTRFQKRLSALEKRNNVLRRRLGQYPETEPEKQKEFKINWERNMKSLVKDLNDVMKGFSE
jgi:hypothetical protein